MKFSLAFLAAVAVNAQEDDDKKFSNKNTFMVSNPPQWWNKHTAQKRMDWNVKNTNKFFSMHFAGMKAEDNLKPLFEDLLEDAARIKTECSQLGNRKRRAFTADEEEHQEDATADEGDPMTTTSASDGTRKVTGDIKADAKKYTLNVARWIKYEVYDLGGECEFLGKRMLVRTDRLRFYVHYAYCKQVDVDQDFCDWFWTKYDGVHPRTHGKPGKKYPRPDRPSELQSGNN